jgi:three-Cys-motif partner protein
VPKQKRFWEEVPLFAEMPARIPLLNRGKSKNVERLWTGNKALLIERYLYYFVLVTKHGTYIDGFAGPQDPAHPDAWSARQVLESEPQRLRHFHLFEQHPQSVRALEELRKRHERPGREVVVYAGDFNARLPAILAPEIIQPKEAAFCLLDQRMFECEWASVERLAGYLPEGRENKIELFYFLAAAWFGRAIAGITTDEGRERAHRWWGRDDWPNLQHMTDFQRAQLVCTRFRNELGYVSALPYAIFTRRGGGRIKYYMIHATDYTGAPKLMDRAYNDAVVPARDLGQQSIYDLLG